VDRVPAVALVAAGGALGAAARFLAAAGVARLCGDRFPWGTLAVNVTGCLAIGLLMGALQGREGWRLLLVTGFLGAYTTFSAFGGETVDLLRRDEWGRAGLYVLGSVAAGLAAVRVGMVLTRG
jgi:CrcB protein